MDVQTVKITSLLGYDLKPAGKYSIGPCPWCGGRDRFTVKHTARGDRWLCRQCGDGRYHDAIYFVMKLRHVTHKQALEILGLRVPIVPRLNPPEVKPMELPSTTWQAKIWRFVDLASDRLFTNDAKAGRDYLASRGLTRATWYAWHLGFAYVFEPIQKRKRPAIVIPWVVETDKTISAVKYRFLDADPEGLRYSFQGGSIPLLFGGWDVIESAETLLLIEGEINALSVWQQRPRGVSVISFGAEQAGEIPESRAVILRDLARNYNRVIIWMDEGRRAKQYEKILGRQCHKLQSPNMEGKLDANRLLVIGDLPQFMREVMQIKL